GRCSLAAMTRRRGALGAWRSRAPPDPVRLSQVFSNLLNNAARYTPPGGKIVVSWRLNQGSAQVSICDNGIGLPTGMLAKIFDMFTQIPRAGPAQPQGGLGIGLALVKGLVEMHGGTVVANSAGEGRGSCFTVCVPALSSYDPSAPAPLGGDVTMGQHRVLVADDNQDAASTLSMLMEVMGHEVRTAHDGIEAVAMAEAFVPELILLDIGMPGIDGYEACRRIRKLPWGPQARIVAMTGWGQEDDRRRSHEAGFDQHLVKPADPAEIERLLISMRGPQAELELP
ncbi:MAG: response regulator, partial [Polaromonas sp.]|nr:response regulator [Polaromonas sp.]